MRELQNVTSMRLAKALLWAALISLGGACDTPTEVLCGPGAEVPKIEDAKLYTCSGEATTIMDIVGAHDVTYITFGAQWCTACQKEVATINAEVVDHFDMNKVGVIQILVENQIDEAPTADVCQAWSDSLKPNFTLLTDLDQATLPLYFEEGISILPMHLVVTRDGSIRYEALGPMTDDLQSLIEPWISAP
jgi:hypothetical protein